MTTYARMGSLGRVSWQVEIRSLNHRYFEFSAKIPPLLYPLEQRIRDLVHVRLRRGKVTLAVSQNGGDEPARELILDEAAVRCYQSALKKLRAKFQLKDELSVRDLITLPRIFRVDRPDQDSEKSWPTLRNILERVLAKAVRLKEMEGRKLTCDIKKRLGTIASVVRAIERRAAGSVEAHGAKLRERLKTLLQGRELDEDRLYREAALLAERSDVTEEVVRMKSHLDLFRRRLRGDGEVGRELDFLCQEMHREINTLGVKAQAFEMANEAVFVKTELEKIREQIQNIE